MARPTALLFDLDGTLVNGDPAVAAAVSYACEAVARSSLDLTPAQLMAANSRAFTALWAFSEQDWTLGRITGEAFSTQVWRRALADCGHYEGALVALAYETMNRRTQEGLRLYKDAAAAIAQVRGRYRLAAVTNGASDTQRPKLELPGIAGSFDVIAVSGELGVAKPDEGIFRWVLDELGVPASEAWLIGDSPSKDIAGARAAGLTSVWLNRRERVLRPDEPQPDYTIESLSELPALLEAAT